MLSTGQEQEMRAGDRALLLATAPETTAVEVVGVAAPPAERAAKAPAAAAPKRVRIDPAATATSPAPPGSDAGPSGSGGPPPVVLILVGVQGAGKSTFSQALLRRAPDRWARVNQETIARGRPGSRAQCVTAARAALQRGVSVVVDRANVTPEQRAFFLEVARQAGVEAHCVALDLPLKACQARAAGRAEHEGGLQGQRAFAVVGMTHKALAQAGPPRREEGLSSVVTCRDDADADAAASAWAAYGPGCLEPWAEWERTRPQKKRGAGPGPGGGQQSLDQFFQRKTAAAAAQPSPRKPPPPSRRDSGASARTSGAGATADQQRSSAAPANAFAKLMAAAKHPPPPPPPPPPRGAAAPATRHSFRFAPALNALIAYADNPAAHPGSVLLADGACVVVADMYPKARAHALVVARSPRLQGPLDLQGPEDAALVRHMKEVGLRWAQEERARRGEDGRIGPWALGFHSVPSMRRLHLHVISRDFDAPSLKTKRHWNSFTTPFFLDVDGERGGASLRAQCTALCVRSSCVRATAVWADARRGARCACRGDPAAGGGRPGLRPARARGAAPGTDALPALRHDVGKHADA
jgi:aprataxin